MPRQIQENRSLNLYEVIGAPLLALVQAEAQSAQATAEFIERLGFDRSVTSGENDLGQLRMITFRYQKPGIDGTPEVFELNIPLLSLLPIPILQVRHADFEFYIRIVDSLTEQDTTVASTGEGGQFLDPTRKQLRATLGRLPSTSTTGRTSLDANMKINVRMEQADIPMGLSRLLEVMDQSTSSTSVITAADLPPVEEGGGGSENEPVTKETPPEEPTNGEGES